MTVYSNVEQSNTPSAPLYVVGVCILIFGSISAARGIVVLFDQKLTLTPLQATWTRVSRLQALRRFYNGFAGLCIGLFVVFVALFPSDDPSPLLGLLCAAVIAFISGWVASKKLDLAERLADGGLPTYPPISAYLSTSLSSLRAFYAEADWGPSQDREVKHTWLGPSIGRIIAVIGAIAVLLASQVVRVFDSVGATVPGLFVRLSATLGVALILCATPVVFAIWLLQSLLFGRPYVRIILRRAADAVGIGTAFGFLIGATAILGQMAGLLPVSTTSEPVGIEWLIEMSVFGAVVGFAVAHVTTLDQISRQSPNRIQGWLLTAAAVPFVAIWTSNYIYPSRVAGALVDAYTKGATVPTDVAKLSASDLTDWQTVLAIGKSQFLDEFPGSAFYVWALSITTSAYFLCCFFAWLVNKYIGPKWTYAPDPTPASASSGLRLS